MQLVTKFNKGIHFLICVIDNYSKYAWIIPLKDKKGITITNAFQKILDESNRKPKKIWVDKDSDFYNRSMKSWLQDNDIEMYLTYMSRTDQPTTDVNEVVPVSLLFTLNKLHTLF